MSLSSSLAPLVTTVSAALACELRRVGEVQVAISEVRSASATARSAARLPETA